MDTGKSQPKADDNGDQVDIDADEEYLDEVDRFESKYNFRFEEEWVFKTFRYYEDCYWQHY